MKPTIGPRGCSGTGTKISVGWVILNRITNEVLVNGEGRRGRRIIYSSFGSARANFKRLTHIDRECPWTIEEVFVELPHY